MKTVFKAIGVSCLLVIFCFMTISCSDASSSTSPGSDFSGKKDNDSGGSSNEGKMNDFGRFGQVTNLTTSSWYWIGGFGSDYTVQSLDNTQANIYLGQNQVDYAILATFNKELGSNDFRAYFMLYEGDEYDGCLDSYWATPKCTSSNMDFVRDVDWDLNDNFQSFYCTDSELIYPDYAYVDYVRYYPSIEIISRIDQWGGSCGDDRYPGDEPTFYDPWGIAVTRMDGEPLLFVCDSTNNDVVIMYGYHSNSGKRGDYLGHIDFGTYEPVGISVEDLGECTVRDVDYYVYHAVVTVNHGNGVGSIDVYKLVCEQENEYGWQYWQLESMSEHPENSNWRIDQNLQQAETLLVGDRIYFIIAAPSIVDSVIWEFYYDFDENYLIDGNVIFDIEGKCVHTCTYGTWNGVMDPFYGVCCGIYNYVPRVYSTGRHRYIVNWS